MKISLNYNKLRNNHIISLISFRNSDNLSLSEIGHQASGPITLWQIDGEKVEAVTDFIFWGSKSTADGDGDCSHEIKRCLLLGGKAMTNLDSVLKSRDIIC